MDEQRGHQAPLAGRGAGDPLPIPRAPNPDTVDPNYPAPPGDRGTIQCLTQHQERPAHVLWRAGCSGMGKSGSEGGSGKRAGGNAGTAPRPDPASHDRSWRAGKPSTGRRGPAGWQHAYIVGRSLVNIGAPWPSLEQAEPRVLAMQTKLHRWAISAAGRRFDDLYNLVYDPAFLVVAWDR